jgi:hypothetical protein
MRHLSTSPVSVIPASESHVTPIVEIVIKGNNSPEVDYSGMNIKLNFWPVLDWNWYKLLPTAQKTLSMCCSWRSQSHDHGEYFSSGIWLRVCSPCPLILRGYWTSLLLNPDEGSSMFLRNVKFCLAIWRHNLEDTNLHIWHELQSPTGKCCSGKQSLFIVRATRNTQIHSVGRKLSPYLTGNTLRVRYKAQPVNAA